MFQSERRSFFRFLFIYLSSTFLLFALAAWLFYSYQKHHLLDKQKETLEYKAEQIKTQLRVLHKRFEPKLFYPQYPSFGSAIYDSNKQYIFGTFKTVLSLEEENAYPDTTRIFYVSKVEPYYLGAAYLLVSKEIDSVPIEKLQEMIIGFMLGAGVLFVLLGVFLGKIFIAPMRDTVEQMNRFIQDTTHELNTPISTILTNIEMLETFGKYEKSRELSRIAIASQTLSRIYDDLTYLNLNHDYHRTIEALDISAILKERMVYFSAMAEVKALKVELKITPNILLQIDKNDLIRVIDNLISNAIKYNKPHGLLQVTLSSTSLCVIDSGMGIAQKDMKVILQRFKRVNSSEGGFGIGLDIVNRVVKSYGFSLSIVSELEQGTKVEIQW